MKTEILKGEKIKDRIPEKVLEDVKLSFEDHGLNFKEDLQHCDMHIKPNGTCWIHDTRNKTFSWNGTLIATFNVDGSGFYFTKNMDRNSERLHEYDKERAEFFSRKRTARELAEFEKKYKY